MILPVLLTGFASGAALIVAIGAQNAYVLRQGLRREHVAEVVLLCIAADVLLMSAGAAGFGAVLERFPWLVEVTRWGGAAFLLVYAGIALRRALRPTAALRAASDRRTTRRGALLTAAALTFLNPHVYLDTVVLLGTLAHAHGPDRWWFVAGSVTASVIWFTLLGAGAHRFAPLLARPAVWRGIDVVVALTMAVLAVSLVLA
ncbi:LysE/ArgO family amino acid transporter [Desertihabitans aurantiacus]|uniref:LysE/ArgO family amino acid transporter n=1 Tax=Desertihabitans aurantiacus TaxID=2282477 RepID=UPI002FCD98DF